MYYFGARYYDPAAARWLSVDPLANQRPSLNPYHYVQNNPLNRIDPNGKFDLLNLTIGIVTKIATMQAETQSAMNYRRNYQTGRTRFEGSGKEFLRMVNSGAGKEVMTASKEQIGEALDKISQAATDANIVVAPVAVLTAPIPVVGEYTAGVSTGLSFVSAAVDVTKAVVTGDGTDIKKATINVGFSSLAGGLSNKVKLLAKGNEAEKLFNSAIEGVENATSAAVSKVVQKNMEDE